MTYGSLFSGVGGLDLAVEACGFGEPLWQAEKDPFCRDVLAKHWPAAKRYTDVREVTGEAQRPEIICGGFPCQDISNAGGRAGIDGERSGLWSEYARVVRVLRPGLVFIENVAALVVRGLDRVLCDLAALGYDAEWTCLRASDVGAPHERDRLFVLAYADGIKRGLQSRRQCWTSGTSATVIGNDGEVPVASDPNGVTGRSRRDKRRRGKSTGRSEPWASRTPGIAADSGCIGAGEPNAARAAVGEERSRATPVRLRIRDFPNPYGKRKLQPERIIANQWGWSRHEGRWTLIPPVPGVDDGTPDRLDREKALGNAVVWQQAAAALRWLLAQSEID